MDKNLWFTLIDRELNFFSWPVQVCANVKLFLKREKEEGRFTEDGKVHCIDTGQICTPYIMIGRNVTQCDITSSLCMS